MNARPEIRDIDRRAKRALREWFDDADEAGIDIDDADSIQAAYEAYFDRVLQTPPADRADPTNTLTMIGIALGEHLVRTTPLEWRVAADSQGTDLAVYNPADGEVFFPVDPVASRWAQRDRGWLADLVGQLRTELSGS